MTPAIRHGVVLAAGLGTRLRPLTEVRAKAAIPLGGEPLIRRIAGWLGAGGATDLVVNLHHRPETIAAALGDGADLDVRVRYSWEGSAILGSAGGPRLALALFDAPACFIVNSDTLTDMDLGGLAAAHASGGALVTMALVPPIDARRYGGVTLGPGGDITGFVPRGPAAAGALHFTGVQAVSPDAFHSVPEGAVASTVGGLYEHLIATRPGSVRGWVTRASCPEVGTVSDYWRTSRMLAAADSDLLGRGRGTRIDPSAHLRRVILWDEVIIEAGCRLEDCIVTDGVRVRAGETHRRSILWRRGGANVVTSFDEANVPTEPPAPLPGRSQ